MRPRLILEFNSYDAIHRFIEFHEELTKITKVEAIAELYSTKNRWDINLIKYFKEREIRIARRAKKRAEREQEQIRKERDEVVAREAQRLESAHLFDEALLD